MAVVTIGPFEGVHFGHRDVPTLGALGVEVHVVDVLRCAGIRRKISSSTVRRAIAAGVPAVLAIERLAPALGDEMGGPL